MTLSLFQIAVMEPSYFFTFEEILIFLKYGNFEAYLAENNPYFITEV
jgi:hypothetical protein